MILKAQMQTVGTRQSTLVRLWPVWATNYGRWYQWWLQSNCKMQINGVICQKLH